MKAGAVFVLSLLSLSLLMPVALSAQNLVPNGDFENGHDGWEHGEVVTENPHGGLACLEVIDDSPTASLWARTLDLIPISHQTSYDLELWSRGTEEGQEAHVSIAQYDEGTWISGNNIDFGVPTGTGWTRFHRIIRAFHQDADSIRVTVRPVVWTPEGELMGTAWFDDVRFEARSEVEAMIGSWIEPIGPVRLWHSPVEQKVGPDDVLDPSPVVSPQVHIYAARGEVEPFQLVLAPADEVRQEALTNVRVPQLVGPDSTLIDSSAFTVREVAYVEVTQPTDYASYTGWRPDPLPLLELPLSLEGGRQQPLWFTIEVPAGIPAGDYTGDLGLVFESGDEIEVPLRLKVWDFDMPDERHFGTAYGLRISLIDRYHNLGGDRNKRREVLRLYLQEFDAHRINTYNPFGDDWYRFSYPNWNWLDPDTHIVLEAESATENRILEVVDERDDAPIAVTSSLAIPIDTGADYAISWRAKTGSSGDDNDYLVSISQYDSGDHWIPHFNIDLVGTGDGTWQAESFSVPHTEFSANAEAVRISLYARRWTESGELVGTAWFDDIRFGGVLSAENLVPNGDFDMPIDEVEIVADFAAFDSAATYAFEELGLDSFRIHLPNFPVSDGAGLYTSRLLGFDWETEAFEQLYVRILGILSDHLEDEGWLSLALAYPFDEPHEEQFEWVIQGMALIHEGAPNLRRLLTKHYYPELEGSVDVWVPLISFYEWDWARERQAAGEAVWWYVCCGPKAPYPNNFIDHPGIEHRIRFWMAWQNLIEGSLYWETTYWTNDLVNPPPNYQDPWQDPQSYYYRDGTVGIWGNGDGRLLYPPRDWADGEERIEGPVPSIRWELLREGIEDYEYFWMLDEAADRLQSEELNSRLVARARELLDIPESIFASRVDYTQDPRLLHTHRNEVAALLEEILDALGSGDATVEVPEDVGPDAAEPVLDAGVDAIADLGLDVAPDTPADLPPDVGDDQATDIVADPSAEPEEEPSTDLEDEPPILDDLQIDGIIEGGGTAERPSDEGCRCDVTAQGGQCRLVFVLAILAGLAFRRRSRRRTTPGRR
ncbi:MAG: DUF4091 domain-containing protein [Bradymonadales bacterium]|nr:DUF4091 domain-containing protein [Bradymonadales bacterium]